MDDQEKINLFVVLENIIEDLNFIKDRITKLEKKNERLHKVK
jgi:hypothetical protein